MGTGDTPRPTGRGGHPATRAGGRGTAGSPDPHVLARTRGCACGAGRSPQENGEQAAARAWAAVVHEVLVRVGRRRVTRHTHILTEGQARGPRGTRGGVSPQPRSARLPTLVVQRLQVRQGAQHGHAVPVGVGAAAGVLRQPQHAQARQPLQVGELGQAGDEVPAQVQLAQLPATAHGLQGRHAVDAAETERERLSATRETEARRSAPCPRWCSSETIRWSTDRTGSARAGGGLSARRGVGAGNTHAQGGHRKCTGGGAEGPAETKRWPAL